MSATRAAVRLWHLRKPLFAAAAVLTILAGFQLPGLSASNSLEIWFPKNDPMLERYADFQSRFGNDDVVVVAVTDESRFDGAPGRERAAEITDSLYYVAGVRSVTSISTVPDAMQLARERLLSADGKTAVFVVQLEGDFDLDTHRPELLSALRAAAARDGERAKMAGYGVIYDALNRSSTQDAAGLLVAAHLAMLLVLAIFLRQWQTIVAAVAVVSCATMWTMGLYAFFGYRLNMVTMALPTLVLVISVANCVHVFRALARQPSFMSQRTRTVRGVARVIAPCVWTSLTTACGFLALSVSSLPILKALGLFGAVGMLSGLAAAFAILPATLSVTRVAPLSDRSFADRLAIQSYNVATRYAGLTIVLSALFFVIAVAGMTRLETDTYSIGYLSDDHPARLDSDFIEASVGAYTSIDFVLETEDTLRPALLDGVQTFQRSVAGIEEVAWTWSLLDALEIDRATPASELSAGDIKSRIVRLDLLSPGLASTMRDETQLRIAVGVPMLSARELQELIAQIEAMAPELGDGKLQPAGYAALYTTIVDRLVQTQIAGFVVALAIIGAIVALATRSLACAFLALPANLIPVAGTLGLMGWLQVPLDVATATIGTVILGLIVDDTMHVLKRRSTQRRLPERLRRNVGDAGGALFITSIVLVAGFTILGQATLRSVAWFGGLSAFAIMLALVTDLLLLPALAVAFRRLAHIRKAWRNTLKEKHKKYHQSILRES